LPQSGRQLLSGISLEGRPAEAYPSRPPLKRTDLKDVLIRESQLNDAAHPFSPKATWRRSCERARSTLRSRALGRPPPNIQSVAASPFNPVPTQASIEILSQIKRRAALAIGAAAFGTVLVFFGGSAVLPGWILIGAGIISGSMEPAAIETVRQRCARAEAACKKIQETWDSLKALDPERPIREATDAPQKTASLRLSQCGRTQSAHRRRFFPLRSKLLRPMVAGMPHHCFGGIPTDLAIIAMRSR
jgi:hypothetical protein